MDLQRRLYLPGEGTDDEDLARVGSRNHVAAGAELQLLDVLHTADVFAMLEPVQYGTLQFGQFHWKLATDRTVVHSASKSVSTITALPFDFQSFSWHGEKTLQKSTLSFQNTTVVWPILCFLSSELLTNFGKGRSAIPDAARATLPKSYFCLSPFENQRTTTITLWLSSEHPLFESMFYSTSGQNTSLMSAVFPAIDHVAQALLYDTEPVLSCSSHSTAGPCQDRHERY